MFDISDSIVEIKMISRRLRMKSEVWSMISLFQCTQYSSTKSVSISPSTLYGMMFAWVCQAYNSVAAEGTSTVWPKTASLTILMGLASGICLGSNSALLQFCETKVSCNAWHPYLAWIPVSTAVWGRAPDINESSDTRLKGGESWEMSRKHLYKLSWNEKLLFLST